MIVPPPSVARRIIRLAGYVFNLLTAAVVCAAIVVSALIGFTLATGHHMETVVTGSMRPQIPIGSLVVTQRVPAGQLQPGNIIAFPEPCNPTRVVVHRIVAASLSNTGLVQIHTKGDANPVADNWPVNCAVPGTTGALARNAAGLTDRVSYIVPAAGTVLDVGRRIALPLLLLSGGIGILRMGFGEVQLYHRRRAGASALARLNVIPDDVSASTTREPGAVPHAAVAPLPALSAVLAARAAGTDW